MLSFESNPQCRKPVFLFRLTLTINITPTNITLCILEKNKSYKAMLRLIIIFKSVLSLQAFLVRRTHFLRLKQQFTYFLSNIQWKTGWNKYIFLKKELCMSYMVFLYKSSPIENP